MKRNEAPPLSVRAKTRGKGLPQKRPARAGTNQQKSDGARDGGAARRTNCQSGIQSGKRPPPSSAKTGSPETTEDPGSKQIRHAQTAAGIGIFTVPKDRVTMPDSSKLQLSCPHSPAQQAAAPAQSEAPSAPTAASSPQCIVAGSQAAISKNAVIRKSENTAPPRNPRPAFVNSFHRSQSIASAPQNTPFRTSAKIYQPTFSLSSYQLIIVISQLTHLP